MQFYKQSTAASTIIGPILDSVGAEYASAVIGDLSISKNGGTLTALAAAATLTYIANGQYTLALTTGNTDTLGRADITCNKSTYQMSTKELNVLPATVFDAFVTNAAGGANGLLLSLASNQVDVGKLLGTTWLTPAVAGTPDVNAKEAGGTTWGSGAITAASIATDAIDADSIKADAITEIQAGLATTANQAAIIAYIDTEVSAIKAVTDAIGATGTGLTAIPWNAAWDSEVQSEVDDAIIAKGLDHLVFASVVGTDIADNSVIARIAASGATADWDTFVQTTDSLQALRDRGDAAWITGSGGGGTGARTVAITVNDGAAALQNAYVRVTNGAETYVLQTSVAGLVTFSLDDATWTVSVTKPGYLFTPTTLLVDGNETQTYSMAALVIVPSVPPYITGVIVCYDLSMAAKAGVVVKMQQIGVPPTGDLSDGILFDGGVRSATSGVDGIAQFSGLVVGATYQYQTSELAKASAKVTIPSGAVDGYQLGSIISR